MSSLFISVIIKALAHWSEKDKLFLIHQNKKGLDIACPLNAGASYFKHLMNVTTALPMGEDSFVVSVIIYDLVTNQMDNCIAVKISLRTRQGCPLLPDKVGKFLIPCSKGMTPQ